MKEKISPRQASVLIFLAIISMKFLFMPATMTRFSGLDIYLCVAFGLVCDMLTLVIYYYCSKKMPDATLFDILSRVFGKIVTKIVYIALAFIFFIKAVFIIKALHLYILDTLYETLPYVMYTVPIAILIFYALRKNLVTYARCCEIFLIVIALAIIACITIPIQAIDTLNFFPMLKDGFLALPRGYLYCAYGFGDYLVLAVLLGHIDYSRSKGHSIIYISIVAASLIVAYYAIFVGVFGNMGVAQALALSDLSIHAQLPNTLGRLDWLIIFLWSFTLVLECVLYLFYCKRCIVAATTDRIDKYLPIVIITLMITTMVILYRDIDRVLGLVTSTAFVSIAFSIYFGVPALILIALVVGKIRERSHERKVKKPMRA